MRVLATTCSARRAPRSPTADSKAAVALEIVAAARPWLSKSVANRAASMASCRPAVSSDRSLCDVGRSHALSCHYSACERLVAFFVKRQQLIAKGEEVVAAGWCVRRADTACELLMEEAGREPFTHVTKARTRSSRRNGRTTTAKRRFRLTRGWRMTSLHHPAPPDQVKRAIRSP